MGHKLQPQPLTAGKTGHKRQQLVYVAPGEKEARRKGCGNVHQGARAEGKKVWWILMHPGRGIQHTGVSKLQKTRGEVS